MSDWIRVRGDRVRLAILVVPKARRDQVVGVHDGRLKIQLTAAPIEGKANAALIRFLARELGLRLADIRLASGSRGRRKNIDLACSKGEVEVWFAGSNPDETE